MSFKLLLSQLGLHVLLPLTSYDLYSQILSVYERSIQVFLCFFFCFCFLFLLQKAEICWHIWKISISRFLWATDGNFSEKYSVTPSWQRTCLWQMTGVRIVLCRSLDFDMFQMTYKYNSVSSEDFGSLKFPWKKVQHSESGWYAHDLRYMFVVTSSSPPWRLINFF